MKSFDSFGSFDEIDLVAYHLHELSPQQELAVRTALTLDPGLAAKSNAIATTLSMFDRQEYPTMIDTAILDNHWQHLRPSLKPHHSRSSIIDWLLPLALATAVALLIVIAFSFSSWSSDGPAPLQAVTPQLPSPTSGGPSVPTPSPLGSHASAAHTIASDRREADSDAQPLPRISAPTIEPDLKSAPLVTNLAFASLPDEALFAATQPAPNIVPTLAPSATPPPTKRLRKQTDLSIGVFGYFVATRNHNITNGPYLSFQTQSATPTAGIVGSFHQQFRPWLGYRVATSYTHSTLTYSNGETGSSGAFYSSTTIPAGIHELTLAYTAQGPSNKRVTTDTELGGGVLVFAPSPGYTTNSALLPSGPAYVNYNYRRTGIGGVGVNFHISKRLDLRTEYRAIVYEAPSFRALSNTHYTVASEPAVSLTYRFGSTTK